MLYCKRLLGVGNICVSNDGLYCRIHCAEALRGSSTVAQLTEEISGDSGKSAAIVEYSVGTAEPAEASFSAAMPPSIARSSDTAQAADELPAPGTSRSMASVFRNLEQKSQQQRHQVHRRASNLSESFRPQQAKFAQQQLLANSQTDPVLDASSTDDALPEHGTAKALLNVWRHMEGQETTQASSRLISVRRSASSAQPQPRRPQTFEQPTPPQPLTSEPQPAADTDELPPANNTRSMLALWRQLDRMGGPAPNPESAERLRSKARDSAAYLVGGNIRMPGLASPLGGQPVVMELQLTEQVAESATAVSDLPAEGTARNLRFLFSAGR